jgi:hypothetical protein
MLTSQELRNRIYSYALETSSIALTPPARDRYPVLVPIRNKLRRQYVGLTQVCRTLRLEFLPLYQRHTQYRVDILDIVIFVKIFILTHEKIDATNASCHLVVTSGMRWYDSNIRVASVLSIIRLCVAASVANNQNVKINFIPRYRIFERLITPINPARWNAFLHEFVSGITATYHYYVGVKLRISIHPKYIEAVEKSFEVDRIMFMNDISKKSVGNYSLRLKARLRWEKMVGITGCVPKATMDLRWSGDGDDCLALR